MFINASMLENCNADRYCDMKNFATLTALSFLLACWVSFQIVSLTVPFQNIGYKCTWIAYPVFQDAICLIVSLPISWRLSIFIEYIPSKTTYYTLGVKVSHTCILMSVPSLLSIDWLTLVTGEKAHVTDMYTFKPGLKYPIIIHFPMKRACSEGKLPINHEN
jgi:hypothetical protein